jgi:hypothetical protein
MTSKTALALAISIGLSAGPILAQDAGSYRVEAGVSTLGLYLAPTYQINDNWTVRAPLYLGQIKGEYEFEGNTVDGKAGVTNGTLMADYRPWANAIRLSGGLGVGGYQTSGMVTNIELDGVTYAGSSSFAVKQKSLIAPVVSIGVAKEFRNGLTIFADVGARVATYEASVTTDRL